jgi:hypothetical protein
MICGRFFDLFTPQESAMTLQSFKLASAGVLSALLLSACGGGGGSSAPATVHSSLSYPLSANFLNRIADGATDNFEVKGNCIADAVITIEPAVPATFETVVGFASDQESSVSNVSCAPGVPLKSGTQTGTTYYDSNATPVGLEVDNLPIYAVFDALPTPLPASATSGDPTTGQGEIGKQTIYEDATKLVVTGHRVLSYAIRDAYSATTVFVDMTTTTYAANGTTLISSETSTYLMDHNDGSLTFKSLKAKFNTSTPYEVTYIAK